MVKVIIQMDGTQDREFSGEFVHVVAVSDAGGKYEAHGGIFGEISPYDLPSVLVRATIKTMKQAYEHLTTVECIGAMVEFYNLFNEAVMDETVNSKEEILKEILKPENRTILERAICDREKKVRNGN